MERLQHACVALIRLVLVVFGLASLGVASHAGARTILPVISTHEGASGGSNGSGGSGGSTKSDDDDDDDGGDEEDDGGDSD